MCTNNFDLGVTQGVKARPHQRDVTVHEMALVFIVMFIIKISPKKI
jgi:hypothetical protein